MGAIIAALFLLLLASPALSVEKAQKGRTSGKHAEGRVMSNPSDTNEGNDGPEPETGPVVVDPDTGQAVGAPEPEEPPPIEPANPSVNDNENLEETIADTPEKYEAVTNNWDIIDDLDNEGQGPTPAPLQNFNLNDYHVTTDVEFRNAVPPSLKKVTPLPPEAIQSLTTLWTKFGQHCNYTKHRAFWKYFWTYSNSQSNQEGTVQSILKGKRSTDEICNGFRYERCEKLTQTCGCDRHSVYNTATDTCQLIEGGRGCGFGWLPIFKDTDVKRQLVQNFPLSCVPNSDCFDQKGCWDTKECDILSKLDPSFKPRTLYSFCNPKKNNTFPYLEALLEETVERSINYDNWIKHGKNCSIAHNFGNTVHTKMKEITIANYEGRQRDYFQMCNPFANEACHPKKKVCLCAKGFLNQNGKCRLVPGNSCEWNPRFEIKLRGMLISEATVSRSVSCVNSASCKKTCFCEKGKKCPKYTEEKWVGSNAESVHAFESVTLTMYYLIVILCNINIMANG